MKLIPVDRASVQKKYANTKNLEVLDEFVKTGMDCARVDGIDESKAHQIASSLRNSARRFGIKTVRVSAINNRVYLLREEV